MTTRQTELDLWLAVLRDRGIRIDACEITPRPDEPSVVPAIKRTVAAVWRSYQDGLRLLERIGEIEEQERGARP